MQRLCLPRVVLGLGAGACCPMLATFLCVLGAWDGSSTRTDQSILSKSNGTRIEITDLAGRTVVLAAPAKRIVLAKGRDIHQLYMLLRDELDDRLAGWGKDIVTYDRGTYDALVERYPLLLNTPLTGSIYRDPVVEQLMALEPDLVVIDTVTLKGAGRETVEQMESVGLPLLFIEMSTDPFEGPMDSLLVLGKAVGKENLAKQIKNFVDNEIRKVDARLSDSTQGPSVYIECAHLGVDKWGHTFGLDVNGRSPAWGAFLRRLHCNNIAEGVVPFKGQMHPEYLLKANPEHIVLTGSHWPNSYDSMELGLNTTSILAESRLRGFTERPGWEDLQAVQDNNVHAVFHGFCMHPDSFAALQQLAKWCYPDRFGDVHPEKSLQEFYRRFMPMDTSGVWFMSLGRE